MASSAILMKAEWPRHRRCASSYDAVRHVTSRLHAMTQSRAERAGEVKMTSRENHLPGMPASSTVLLVVTAVVPLDVTAVVLLDVKVTAFASTVLAMKMDITSNKRSLSIALKQ